MSFLNKQTPSVGLSMDFLGMSGDDTVMAISPQQSLLDYGDDFSDFGDSMFPLSQDTQPMTQEAELLNFSQTPTLNPATNTVVIPTAFGTELPLQNGAIGDTFYRIQQAPSHPRQPSLTSPTIVMGEQPYDSQAQEPGYFERDFINGGFDRICLESSEELAQSGLDVDLIHKVSKSFNVQRPPVLGQNMHGVVALRVGIHAICQPHHRNPPTDTDLLKFLGQGLSRVRDENAPQIREAGIDRPLTSEHLLMMLSRYGLLNREEYNLGIIRSPLQPAQFGASPTYQVTLERAKTSGSKTVGSKTVWLYEEGGAWFPLAQDNFAPATKSYAEALKAPARPQLQRPTTPISNNSLLPPDMSPSTPYTPSEAGSDGTGATNMSCRSCHKRFDAQADLTHHMRNHRPKSLPCPHCHKSFLWSKDLRRHISTHSDKGTRMDHICQVFGCGKAYTRPDNLRRHYRQDHPGLPLPSPSSVTSSRHSRGSRHL